MKIKKTQISDQSPPLAAGRAFRCEFPSEGEGCGGGHTAAYPEGGAEGSSACD